MTRQASAAYPGNRSRVTILVVKSRLLTLSSHEGKGVIVATEIMPLKAAPWMASSPFPDIAFTRSEVIQSAYLAAREQSRGASLTMLPR